MTESPGSGRMGDTDLAILELEAPALPGPSRAVPLLGVAISILLSTAVLSALFGVGRGHAESPRQRLAAAAGAAAAQDFAFEVTVDSTGAFPGRGLTLRGALDVETRRLRATVDIGLAGSNSELVQDGTTQYLKAPAEMARLLGSDSTKPWVRIDLSSIMRAQDPAARADTNPLDVLARLDAIVGPIERVGSEDVRGEPTVHFHTLVDATKNLPTDRVVPNAESLRRVPYDVWLDDHDRPRRVRQSVTLRPELTITTTTETFDFGKSVSVELPPADQVSEVQLPFAGATSAPQG